MFVNIVVVLLLSHVQLFVRPWTVALKVPLFMGFPRQEYWRDLPFPSSGDICDPGIESVSPALAGRFFTTELPGNPLAKHYPSIIFRTDAVILLLLFFFLLFMLFYFTVSICGQKDSIFLRIGL